MLVLKKKTRRVPLKELLIFNLIKHTHPLSVTGVWLSHGLTSNRSASPFNGLTNFPQIRVFNKESIEDAVYKRNKLFHIPNCHACFSEP